MKSLEKTLVNSLNSKGYVKFDPKTVSNKVFNFIGKNKQALVIESLNNGLAKISLKKLI